MMLRVGIYRPVSVQRANHVLTHALGVFKYTNGVGITLSCSSVQVFLGPKVVNRQKPDTPLFFCSYGNTYQPVRFWVFVGLHQ